MLKRIFISLSIIAVAISSCKEDAGNPPRITFDGEGISGIFAGDDVTVSGKVQADNKLSGVYWFHQKLNAGGNLDEQTGGQLELSADGSFSIPVPVTINTIGVKIVAEDDKGSRNVAVFPIILGEDALVIAFEGDGFIASIEAGEELNVKGTVNSGTPITSLTYTVVKGDLTESPVSITPTGEQSSVFDIKLPARVGMTGIRIHATNRGSLVADKMFEIRRVSPSGPVVLFDKEKIEVKPDSVFAVSGQVVTDGTIASVSYVVYKEGGSNPAQTITLDGDKKFNFNVTANEKITAVAVVATDTENKEGEETIPVEVLYPSRIDGSVMVHYKNLMFTDSRTFEKSYFSFDIAPYVLNATQATANQANVYMMYTNVFVSTGNASNGAALFGANAYWASTVLAQALTADWTLTQGETQLARLPVRTDMVSAVGKSFDELGDSADDWTIVNTWAKGISSSNSVLRSGTAASTVGVGTIFVVQYGGVNSAGNGGINKYAVGIVRGKGGTPATAAGQSTGSWLEVEIKTSK